MSQIQSVPKHTIIEKTALALAAAWYEIGRSQGLKSKHKNARLYAAHNLEKFIPKACDYLLDMLGRNDVGNNMKEEIYEAFQERHNDPTLGKIMPNFDVKKAIEYADEIKRKNTKPIDIVLDKTFDVKELLKPDFKNSTMLSNKDTKHGQEK